MRPDPVAPVNGKMLKFSRDVASMRRTLIVLALLLIAGAVMNSCAKKSRPARGQIVTESSSPKFMGHKVTVLVKAAPEQLMRHFTEPDHLRMDLGPIKIAHVSGEKLEKVGDSADYRIQFPGASTVGYRMTLIHRKGDEELWLMTETTVEFLVSVLRYQFKRVPDGTLMTCRFELQEPKGAVLGPIARAFNLNEQMVKGTEFGVAGIQQEFDPTVNPDQLLDQGLRGESYVTFFSASESRAYINAPPSKVDAYLTSPETWQKWEKIFKVSGFGRCLTAPGKGACQATINLVADYKLDFFNSIYEPGKLSSSWFTSPIAGVGRVQTMLKPKGLGTEMSIYYMIEVSQLTPAGTELLLNLSRAPQTVEQIIADSQITLESSPKI